MLSPSALQENRHVLALGAGLAIMASVFLLYPILRSGSIPNFFDAKFHLQLADGLVKGLRDGYLYPRWLADANLNFGSTALISYSPLSAYAVALMTLIMGNVVRATMAVLGISTLLSGFTFYSCARSLARPLPSALAAALYTVVPYRAIDVHTRFAFAEIGTFVWLPLILKLLIDLHRKPTRSAWISLVLAYAGLILTHILSAFMVAVALAPYVVWIAVRERNRFFPALLLLAAISAAALAAVYLIPVVYERDWTHTEFLAQSWWGDWRRNFLFFDEESAGFRADTMGPYVEKSIILMTAPALGAFLILARRRDHDTIGLGLLCLVTVFLQLRLSRFVWQWLPGMEYIQFPWRFQLVLALGCCLLIARALSTRSWTARVLVGISAVLWIAFLGPAGRETSYTLDNEMFVDAEISRGIVKEHIPRGVVGWERLRNAARRMGGLTQTEPPAEVEIEEWSSHRRRLRINADQRTELQIRTFYYPGWAASVDGRETAIKPVAPLHTIGLEVGPGVHDVEVRFGSTPDRRAGAVCSLAAAIMLLVVGFAPGRRRNETAG